MNERKNAINNIHEEDEVITVTLSRGDYQIIREIIDKQKSLNWLGRYMRNILFATIGGLSTLFIFGDQIKAFIGKIFS